MSLVKYIAIGMLPLSHAEGPRFIQFVKALSPEYVIPSKTVIKDRLEVLYQSVRKDILATLRNFYDVSITTDAWTSRSAVSFITITVHAIDELWNLFSVTLNTLEMTESHSAANIYHHLCNALSEWNLADKIIAVVHDNARNMVAAMRESSTADIKNGQSVRCVCHSLQLVIKKAFNEEHFQIHLQKVSAIVGHFKHSYKATKALKDAQKLHNLPDHSLISYCVTRWNSAYNMVERLLEQRQAVESVLLNLEFTTTVMCKKLLLHDPPKIQSLKEVFREELEAQFLEEDYDSVPALACFLDPRYKNMADETQEFRESVQEKILEIMAKENVKETPAAITKNKREKNLDYLFNCEALSQSFERMASFESDNPNYLDNENEREINSFKMEPNIPLGDNPLHWWHSKRHKFPKLARLARRYLGVPASNYIKE
ncbi:zinc finger BED domain-containing protein RICESLEEPER 3-like [Cotesia glomerata]|uniref:zinc finger BED domain-containing protein RICESLEEPER 3-like n=1 Tax=Cotesia glomerata TaxID=32391 RepID=UPI001D028F27|nr:zinc finger BED domain-containing protein RICESLEEPER 3-like [Cotesia glomerata]